MLWDQFTSNPLVGVMDGAVMIRENSYLSTGARVGLMGADPDGDRDSAHHPCHPAGRQDAAAARRSGHCSPIWRWPAWCRSRPAPSPRDFLLATMSIHLMLIYVYLALFGFLTDYAEEVMQGPSDADPAEVSEFAEWEELAFTD